METELVTPMSLINNLLGQLNWGGSNPRNWTKPRIVLGFSLWFFITMTFILDGVFLLTNFGFLMIDVVMFAGFWQLVLKQWTLIRKHQCFLKLINITEYKFWSLDILPASERSSIQTVYNIANFAARSYFVCISIAALGHFITAYFRGKENLVNNIWLPDSLAEWNRTHVGHHVIFIFEMIIMTESVIGCLSPIDGIYIILIALVIGQLKIMKCKLMAINAKHFVEHNMREIAACVEHHNLLFDYLKTIEEIFSTELLHVAGSNIVIAVLTMYYAMVESDISRQITYCLIFAASNGQLFIYCFMGQLIQDETMSVADAAYFSKWEDIPDKNVRLSLLLIILRSQKYVNITMGGMFILCLDTFTKISRMMLSLLTFMLNSDIK